MKIKGFIILKQDHIYKRIALDDVIFIKVKDYVLTCVLENDKAVVLYRSMEEFRRLLPPGFVQISRDKIINLYKITSLNKKSRSVTLIDQSSHRVAARRIKDVLHTFYNIDFS